MKPFSKLNIVSILCFIFLFIHCGKKSTEPEEMKLISIEILPITVTLSNGQTQQFLCNGYYSDESSKRVENNITWSLFPGTSGYIDETGLFTAYNKTGAETITAIYLDKQTQAVVIVQSSEYESPTASFEVIPSQGTLDTVFSFDASACTDDKDSVSVLQIRWDWENDGTWDTNYSIVKNVTYQYSTEGIKTIKMEVKDTDGFTDLTTKQLSVTAESENTAGTLTDIDGNIYLTIKIGNQWWMADNLKVRHYRNGDVIAHITNGEQWGDLEVGAYCYYDNDVNYHAVYGCLYNWYVVNDSRNIAPEGWHVPTDEEWKELEIYLGMSQTEVDGSMWRGTDEGGKLKENSTVHWQSPNLGATNESCFSALPSGYRGDYTGLYYDLGRYTAFWSFTGGGTNTAWYRRLDYDHSEIRRNLVGKQFGFSIRLVKD